MKHLVILSPLLFTLMIQGCGEQQDPSIQTVNQTQTLDPALQAKGWFESYPTVGNLDSDSAMTILKDIGEPVTPGLFGTRPYEHTAHAFGYIAPAPPGAANLSIVSAVAMAPDNTLRNKRIKVTLDKLRVADYPGHGLHQILFDFYGQNQAVEGVEHLHFNSTYRAQEGEEVAVIGYPIFVGLSVKNEGVSFKCYTVNVENKSDESFLEFLNSDVMKSGLKLGVQAQPAIAPLANLALGITKSIAARHRNVAVQDFFMGLDFSNISTRAKLAEGSYLAVQVPQSALEAWNWSDWKYNPTSGQIVSASGPQKTLPFNYVVFGVSRYSETDSIVEASDPK